MKVFSIAAFVSSRMARVLFGYLIAVLGMISFVFLILSALFIFLAGDGGRECIGAYPVMIRMKGFGGYLLMA